MSGVLCYHPGVLEPTVGILVDYESSLARSVAEKVWSGLSTAALGAGYTKTTALWESLGASSSLERLEGARVCVFTVGQDRPDAVEAVRPVSTLSAHHLYGIIVAVPERPSPLAGSLLYQGVERLTTGDGVKAGAVEPALLRARYGECESYAERLLDRLRAQ